MATFQNNKEKYWFSDKTRLVFVLGNNFKEGFRNSAIFKLELFATVGNGRAYNQWTVVFVCCCGNSTIFKGKIKIGWKWLCFEGVIRYAVFFFVDIFEIFLKTPSTFCFTNILFHFENQFQKSKLASLSILSSRILLTETTINICSEKC